MAEWIGSPDVISVQDVLRTEIIVNQALIDILLAKNEAKQVSNNHKRILQKKLLNNQ